MLILIVILTAFRSLYSLSSFIFDWFSLINLNKTTFSGLALSSCKIHWKCDHLWLCFGQHTSVFHPHILPVLIILALKHSGLYKIYKQMKIRIKTQMKFWKSNPMNDRELKLRKQTIVHLTKHELSFTDLSNIDWVGIKSFFSWGCESRKTSHKS